jgi:hypothetical protein
LVTELAESGARDELIMNIARHVSRAMLLRYSHVRMEAKGRALDEIAARQNVADENSSLHRIALQVLDDSRKAWQSCQGLGESCHVTSCSFPPRSRGLAVHPERRVRRGLVMTLPPMRSSAQTEGSALNQRC